jgi:hypothetical protein
VLGVLSALPIISAGNVCCCLWIVSGGVVAAYLLQQDQRTAITPGDGALVGLLAGLVGAGVYLLLSIPVALMFSPLEQRMMERLSETMQNLPPQFRTYATVRATRTGFGIIVASIVGFCFMLVLGAIFSTLGGLLGALAFAKKPPPGTIDVTPVSPVE